MLDFGLSRREAFGSDCGLGIGDFGLSRRETFGSDWGLGISDCPEGKPLARISDCNEGNPLVLIADCQVWRYWYESTRKLD